MRVFVSAALVAACVALMAPSASAQRGGTAGGAATGGARDTAQTGADTARTGQQLSLKREIYSYSAGGRRDPMVSLLNTADLRPLLSEIELISVIYQQDGNEHRAVLRDRSDKKVLYRVKVGETLGRNRVTQITRRDVLFTIEEFGFSRQERLSIKPDTTAARTP